MARVIAIGPGGRAQAPARSDQFRPVIELVHSNGWFDRWLLSPVCQSEDRAEEVKQGLYRSAFYFCSCGVVSCTRKFSNYPKDEHPGGCPRGGQRLSIQAYPVRDSEGFIRVQFRVMDKREAMRAVVQRYGPDPNKWPYFGRRKRA